MRCLFAGLGGVGQRHLRNLRELLGPDAPIAAYRVRGESQVVGDRLRIVPEEDVAARYGVTEIYDLDAALRTGPDIVLITNPSSEHVPVAVEAARRGCHLFVEKPLSSSLDGVEELVRIVDERGTVGFVAYQLRQHPGFRMLRSWLECGAIGTVLAARAEVGEHLPGFHPYEDYRRMYASRRDLGGGVILTQIHELDYLYALFGMPERVFSLGGHVSSLEIDVEDLAISLLEYRRPDGRVLPVHVHQDYFQRPTSRSCRVLGERGRIDWDLAGGALVRYDAEGRVAERCSFAHLERNRLFVDELAHFLECVRGAARPEVSLRDGEQSLRMGLALLESQRTGRPVRLSDGVAEEAA